MRDERTALDADSPDPVALIVGMVHLARARDWNRMDLGDVTSETRSAETADLVDRLAAFRPTHVAVEHVRTGDEAIDARCRSFLDGLYTLGPHEVEQVGFRLAARMGHLRVHPIDWMGSVPGERELGDVMTWAESHQSDIYREPGGRRPCPPRIARSWGSSVTSTVTSGIARPSSATSGSPRSARGTSMPA